MAMSGMQQAIAAAIRTAAENLPEEIRNNILQIGQIVADFQGRLERIETKQDQILTLLQTPGLVPNTKGIEYDGHDAAPRSPVGAGTEG